MKDIVLKPDRCASTIYEGWQRHQCSRKAVVQEDGKGWCKQHAPSSVKKRRDDWDAKYKAKSELSAAEYSREKAERDRAAACVAACEGMADPVAEIARMRRELALTGKDAKP